MIIHRHALLVTGKHLLIIEVNAPPKGRWMGYVYLRLIEIDNAIALKMANGQQKTFVQQDGVSVFESLQGNKFSKGPKSSYTKALRDLELKFEDALCKTQPEALDLLKGDIRIGKPSTQDDIELMEHIEHREEYDASLEGLLTLWDDVHFDVWNEEG